MATINQGALTLLDFAKRLNPATQSVETEIAEMLTQTNEILLDMLWKEGNTPTGHTLTMRTGLPSGVWRKFNQGVPSDKSQTIQVTETCGMYEQRGKIDKDLAMLNGNTGAFRMSENDAHIQAMNIDMATALFYADPSTPEKFIGLAPRYSTISGAINGQNVMSGGGSGSDNTSIWLVGWGANSVYGIFPKGSVSGLQHKVIQDGSGDGCADALDADGNPYRALVDHYQWKAGLALKDWRYVVRICNIDVSNLVAESSPANLIKLMSRAIDRLPSTLGNATQEGFKGVKPVFYVNRTVFSMLKVQAFNTSGGGGGSMAGSLAIEDAILQFGGSAVKTKQLTFLGIPIRICDSILLTEATVA